MASSDFGPIAIIGCGKMGEAILRGWLSSDASELQDLDPGLFTIVQPDADVRARQVSEHGVSAVGSVAELSGHGPFEVVLLAVKPQTMDGVLDDLSALVDDGTIGAETLFITIAAGLPTSKYEQALPIDEPRVVRVMPNMPLQVGRGASAVAAGANATGDDVSLVDGLFGVLGDSWIVDEDDIDAVCAISGGGPAYFAYMVEALGRAGQDLGLDREMAEQLALSTMGGTYHAIVETDTTPEAMRESVCSPGGTTLAALASMDADGFTSMFSRAMSAAVRRAEELKG